MSFEQTLQEWITIDNQIKQINAQLQLLRDKKNKIIQQIQTQIESKQLTSPMRVNNEYIKIVKTKDTQPLTFHYLQSCLEEIIQNKQQVEKIIEFIKDKRQVKYITDIKRVTSRH